MTESSTNSPSNASQLPARTTKRASSRVHAKAGPHESHQPLTKRRAQSTEYIVARFTLVLEVSQLSAKTCCAGHPINRSRSSSTIPSTKSRMDALEFLKERKRLCNSCKGCDGCPLEGTHCVLSYATDDKDHERIIATVEQWSEEHPRKTRQSVFLEKWPETEIDMDGVIQICPMPISAAHRDSNGECKYPEKWCSDCRREFWMQEEKEESF